MTTSPLVFLDTETTGLTLDDDIWEFAAIRREPDGTERELHLFLEHDTRKCALLPESFRADHERRFPLSSHGREWAKDDVELLPDAARRINEFLQGRPHIVGAVPNFDTERLAKLLSYWIDGWTAPWHYHLIDVENLAVGYLRGLAVPGFAPPWNSDEVSSALGVTVPEDERHTAMGDARWAMRLYDAVLGGPR